MHPVYAKTLEYLENGDVATIQSVETVFENVVNAIAAISGVVFLLMLVSGGFSFLFSGGDAKKIEKARGTITNSIFGLIIISLAYFILYVIEQITGVNVTTFRINIF